MMKFKIVYPPSSNVHIIDGARLVVEAESEDDAFQKASLFWLVECADYAISPDAPGAEEPPHDTA